MTERPASSSKKAEAKADKPAKSTGKSSSKLKGAVPQPQSDESASYIVRKIHNGYLVSESRYDSKKGYISRDTYVPTKPVITIGAAKDSK